MSRTPPPLIVRSASVEDAKELYKVIHESYRGRGGWTTEADLVSGQRITMEDLKTLLLDQFCQENEPILVAELNTPDANGDRIIGCVQCAKGTHGSKASTLATNEEKVSRIEPLIAGKTPNDDGQKVIDVSTNLDIENPAPTFSTAMIGLFGVLPTYQSKGIGRVLAGAALKHIQEVWKCKRCELRVLEMRPELLAWYEKMGFVRKEEKVPFFLPELLLKKGEFIVLERVF